MSSTKAGGHQRQKAYNFFIISKLEVILHHIIFVLLDLVLVQLPLLDFLEVPGDNIFPGGSDNGIFLLALPLVEPNRTDNSPNREILDSELRLTERGRS